MNFNKLQATRKTIFTFLGAYKGDNQIATISDVNEVYNRLNNLFPYRMYDVVFNQEGTNPPTFVKLAAGASECTRNCSAGAGSSCACDCKVQCTNETAGIITLVPTYIEPGVYDLTFNLDPKVYPNPIAHVGFFVSSVINDPDVKLSVTRRSANVYRITSSDKTGLANGLIVDKVVSFKIYF